MTSRGDAGGGKRDLIVIGASAGGVEAVLQLAGRLPENLDAAVVVVIHMGAQGAGRLPHLLARRTRLAVTAAENGMPLQRGRVHVAVPGHHLLVSPDATLRVAHGPRENGTRPSIDRLFRSATAFGPRVVAVLLTGMLDDGAVGLVAMQRAGATTVVQDPDDAAFPGMPTSAIALQGPDHVVALDAMPDLFAGLAGLSTPDARSSRIAPALPDVATCDDEPEEEDALAFDDPTDLTCPDCHGVLRRSEDDIYRCHTGHRWSPASLVEHGAADLETALWSARRALEEQCMLAQDLSRRLAERGAHSSATRFRTRADDLRRHADTMRQMLMTEVVGPAPAAERAG